MILLSVYLVHNKQHLKEENPKKNKYTVLFIWNPRVSKYYFSALGDVPPCLKPLHCACYLCPAHRLRTPNEGINQRNLRIWANVADKISFGRTKRFGIGS